MTRDHLSELDLARLCLDGAEPPAHVADCARCRQTLDELRAEAASFARQVFPRTLPSVEARLAPRRRVWWASAAFAALAVGALWIAVRGGAPGTEPPVIAAKGGPALHLVAHRTAGAEDRVFGVDPGAGLVAGDAIRFVLDGAPGDYLLVVSLDGAGQINVYYPYGGDRSARIEPRDPLVLDGSIVLDDAPGPERIWAVVSDRAIALADLRAQLGALAAGGAGAIRHETRLEVPDARQATTWFEKSALRPERTP